MTFFQPGDIVNRTYSAFTQANNWAKLQANPQLKLVVRHRGSNATLGLVHGVTQVLIDAEQILVIGEYGQWQWNFADGVEDLGFSLAGTKA